MKSISFYLLQLIIKLKGIKKIFSETPINYQKLRAGNVHVPSEKNVLGLNFKTFTIGDSTITKIFPREIKSNDLILYCPGGSFVSGPNDFNWKSISYIIKETGIPGYMIDYPKAPENKIDKINAALDAVYSQFSASHPAKNIILFGGSVGGTLMILLVQRLIKKQLALPKKLVLITPVTDCSMTNSLINEIEKKDIVNSKAGILSAHQMCAGNINLKSDAISPIYGNFKSFIPTLIFIAENDIQKPDAKLFSKKLKENNVEIQIEYGKGMPHIYPLLPISEGKKALRCIINYLNPEN